MHPNSNIADGYNRTAGNYADKFLDELSHKPFDRMLIKAFASENCHKGRLIDLGCGPGQVTKFVYECGLKEITGIDISSAMISIAKEINPLMQFEVANILQLPFPDRTFGSAIAFYSLIHFDYNELKQALKEIKRVLVQDGELLMSFHIGNNNIHLENFLDHQVSMDFHFFETEQIRGLLTGEGFNIIDTIERYPYKEIEYQGKRAYIWANLF